jgi:hypothetical protein
MNTQRLRYLSGAISALLIVLLLSDLRIPGRAAPAAPTFSVNSPADIVASVPLDNGVCETAPGNGVCTLRAAIMKANHYPGGGATINFELPGVTYTLTLPPTGADDEASGDLNITNTLTIMGHGAGHTIIDGHTTDRVLAIDTSLIPVTISGVTVENGRACFGGGISSGGRLTLVNSTISRNAANCPGAAYGGGIYSVGALTNTHSTVSEIRPAARRQGAGVYLIGEQRLLRVRSAGT